MTSNGGSRDFKSRYKNIGSDSDSMRRRREEETVRLRKDKRDQQMTKRRNIQAGVDDDSQDSFAAGQKKVTPIILDDTLVQAVMSGNPSEELKAVQKFRKLLSKEPDPPINEVIRSGVVPKFVEFLKCDDRQKLQFESAWALTNIASGNAEQTRFVMQCGAVPDLIRLLGSPSREVQEQCIWALGNISGDSPECRDYLLEAGALEPILRILNSLNEVNSMAKNGVWAVSNFCRGKNPSPDFNKVSHCIPVLTRYLQCQDSEVVADACWSLSYLSDGPNNKIQAVINGGIVPVLVQLLVNSPQNVLAAALRAIGNIVTGDDAQTQTVLNCNALAPIKSLLMYPKENIRKEAAWTVSNIAAGSKSQIQALWEAGIFPLIVNLSVEGELRTKKEAAWVMSNVASGGDAAQVHGLVEAEAIQALCSLLSVSDPKLTHVALTAIERILRAGQNQVKRNGGGENRYAAIVEECSGLDKIEFLQSHENNEVYQKAFGIVNKYFSSPEGDENTGPSNGVQLAPNGNPQSAAISFQPPAGQIQF
ncbi:unnamed protein product [Cyprideis torosa]|uniref:Importin subunit alpha n=1 Tax=Cyprideis torosa TaxID=163714 RepID=A0A7R8WJN2_9CRUS|nr:unnamed protein product [Cyprideis torosa]CAG0902202.1 unnamed protein product [Cyprideis torosa]